MRTKGGKKRSKIKTGFFKQWSFLSFGMRMKGGRKRSKIKTGNLMDVSGIDPKPEHQLKQGEENMRLLGFACSDCLDFQLDLANSALEYYKLRKDHDHPTVFEDVQVLAACFLNSWPRRPFKKYKSTDKCHISFSAKQKTSGFDDVSIKWFFAELIEVDDGDFRPTLCEMLDPSDRGITYGCGYCPPEKKFPHPPERGEETRFSRLHQLKLSFEHNAAGFKHHHRPAKLDNLGAAKIALTYGKMDSMYQVEDVAYLEKMPFFWIEREGTNMWYHVGFTAKPSNTSSSEASPKRFFGELRFDEDTEKFIATYCTVLETADSGIRRGCGFCQSAQFLHPAGGYRCGDWVDPPPLLFTDPSYEWESEGWTLVV